MSQQSNGEHPQESQISRPKSSKKKEKGQFVVWHKHHWNYIKKDVWWKVGVYKTETIAQNVIEQQKRTSGGLYKTDIFVILSPGQKPD